VKEKTDLKFTFTRGRAKFENSPSKKTRRWMDGRKVGWLITSAYEAGGSGEICKRRGVRERRVASIVFSCACSLIRPHCSGCPFPSPDLKALGSATQGQARDRDSRASLGNPQDKRHIRQTNSGRSARVATRPESQAAPPHNSIFRDDCHRPAMVRLTGGYARCARIAV
jgi:hypothetical protein